MKQTLTNQREKYVWSMILFIFEIFALLMLNPFSLDYLICALYYVGTQKLSRRSRLHMFPSQQNRSKTFRRSQKHLREFTFLKFLKQKNSYTDQSSHTCLQPVFGANVLQSS